MNSDEKKQDPREHIEYIRREDYGVDPEASEQEQRRLKSLRDKLDRTLKILAEDLYSKQTHFVLELIQNADDNTYLEGVLPRLSFSISPQRLLLSNNEVGFSKDHVRAICDVGKSSKRSKNGYIGEKGIGFKSVFTVSNSPEIHSSGYHFRFNKTDKDNLLGYVVPEWLDQSDCVSYDGTTIILPAKPDQNFGAEILEGLNAELLLFLTKLRELEILHNGRATIFKRVDKASFSDLASIIVEEDGRLHSEESRFLRHSMPVSMHEASDEKRSDMDISYVVLAFPVDPNGKANPQSNSQVFAFLPIRRFGFKFSIQADFILSSSREDIHIDRKWNQRLRDSIARAFVDAIDEFKKTEALSFSYLQFIPNDQEVTDPFFKPVISQIVALLSESKCLPSAGGNWRIPSELRIASREFQEFFPPSTALELFGFDYVDIRVDADEALLRRLGAKPITNQDIVSVFRLHGDWLSTQPKEWKAKWYASLADLDRSELLEAGLISTACIPTSTGAFVSPAQTSVFYPLNRGTDYGFEHELTIIDSELLDEAGSQSTKVDEFFAALNVKKDNAFDLVNSHILPRHRGEAWKTSEHKALLGHLRYIKHKLDQYLNGATIAGKSTEEALNAVRNGIWIGTKHNTDEIWFFDRTTNVYLSNEYQPRFCIESLLGEDLSKGLLVSSEYLSTTTKDVEGEAESWRQFLFRIGVCEAPKIKRLHNGNFQCSTELQALLDSPQSSIRKAVLECLDQNWHIYSGSLVFQAREGRSWVTRDTMFRKALVSMKAPTRRRANIPICDSYYPSEEIKQLFGDTPVYIDANLTQPELLQACQITFRADANSCIKRLKQLKMDGGDTTQQLHSIYRHLERLWDKEGSLIKQAFNQEGLIRVKGPHAIWARPDEVAWRSSGKFMDSLYPPLQGQYRDFSTFFNNMLGIPGELPTAKVVAALPRLGEIESVEERVDEAIAIYKRADRALRPKTGKEVSTPDWLDTFLSEAVFLNQHGALVANDENLFVNDSPELGALFASDPDISLFDVPFEDLPRVRSLLNSAKVQSLANSVEVKVIEADGGQVREDLTAKLRSVVVYIGRALYCKNLGRFEAALDQRLFERLRDLEIVEVPDLRLEVTVANASRTATWDIAMTVNRILIKRGAKSIKDQLAIEICKILGAPDELADIISRLLLTEDAEEAEDFLQVRQVSPLPLDVEKALRGEESEPHAGATPDDVRDLNAQEPENFENTGAGISDDNVPAYAGTPSAVRQPAGAASPEDQQVAITGLANVSPLAGNQKSSKEASPSSSACESMPLDKEMERPSAEGFASALHTKDARETDQSAPSSGVQGETTLSSGLVAAGPHGASRPEPQLGPRSERSAGGSGRRTRKQGGGHRTKRGRLMSYAASPADAERASKEEDPARVAARDATAQAAVDYFMATQGARWKSLIPMPHYNPGFDIKAVSHEDQDEFIEVKGQSGAWTEDGVALTPTELAEAQRRGERYWLCVVEYATDEKRRTLYLLNNPYGLTQQFRFDSGWKSAAHSEAAVPMKPEAGLNIDLPGLGKGRILSVRKKGQFYKLHIVFESGQVNKVFNPATMTLSKE